jgi:hypothetical protein
LETRFMGLFIEGKCGASFNFIIKQRAVGRI